MLLYVTDSLNRRKWLGAYTRENMVLLVRQILLVCSVTGQLQM